MKTSIEVKAKSVHLAIENACEQLGVTQDKIDVEILSQGGMFTKAKIIATLKEEKPVSQPEPKAEPVQEKQKAPVAADTVNKPAPEEGDQTGGNAPLKPALKKEKKQIPDGPVVPGLKFEKTTEFVKTLLNLLENDATVTTENTETSFNININGENVGRLIGKNGGALSALQSLVSSVAINHAGGESKRVFVNIGDYKERRGDTLQALAKKKAEYVKSSGRSVKLEPMNSRDRAIIHTALQGVEGVRTYSTGKDPFRCLCIAPAETKPSQNP